MTTVAVEQQAIQFGSYQGQSGPHVIRLDGPAGLYFLRGEWIGKNHPLAGAVLGGDGQDGRALAYDPPQQEGEHRREGECHVGKHFLHR